MSNPRIGVALFGMGRAGTIHFLNLVKNPRVEILYIMERDAGIIRAKEFCEKYHLENTDVLDSNHETLPMEDDAVKAVIICTPTFDHESTVREALRNGKAVFCEKPISQAAGGTAACYEDAVKAGKPLFCSFNRRFDPSFRNMQKRVCAGEVGKIHVIKTCSRDSPLPSLDYLRISGGIFQDCAVHDIDVVCWVMGERPITVFALAHAHNEDIGRLDDVDTVVITMKFASGALATIDLSRHALYGYDQRAEVFGSKGMLMSNNQRSTELTSQLESGTKSELIKFSFPQRYAEAYAVGMDHFLDVVEGKADMEVTKDDVINVSCIATACEQSFKTGLPVKLIYDDSCIR